MNMDDHFREMARRQPSHPAIFGPRPGDSMTYAQLDGAIEVASGKLQALGVKRGDCIGLHLPGSAQYIIWNYGVWRCGGCVVPIPAELAVEEKTEICRQIALTWVISRRKNAGFADVFRRTDSGDLGGDLVLAAIRSPREHPAGFHDVNSAFIRFTSGTTGDSKGVVLSHQSIDERISAANEALHIGPRDRVVWVLSMSYHFTVSIVGYLTLGATIVLPTNHFAAAIFEAIRRHAATLLYASPIHLALLADSPEAAPLPLRLAISTTISLDSRIAKAFVQRCGIPISQALGIIEIGLPCINVDLAADHPGSVGPVLPAYELRLEDVGLGPQMREILFRGPGFLDAYYHPWQTRDAIMPDGWFRTGDVGYLGEDRCLFLRGRSKDVINVMGMKFFPHEVESVLESHPQVLSASVFAQADERWGEAPHARVVARSGLPNDGLEDNLRKYCLERLASYKVPQRIEFVGTLPKTASGKVLHRAT
jgi:long-chain acyl-CoA synthetase